MPAMKYEASVHFKLSFTEYFKVKGKRSKIAVDFYLTAIFRVSFKPGESLFIAFSQTMFIGKGYNLIKPAVG